MEIKEVIKELRKKGQTHTTIAAKLGVTELTVRRWETGSTPCNIATVAFLTRLLRKKA